MLELQNILDALKVVELSTKESSSTKWKFRFTTKLTVFAALLKSVSVGYEDVLLPPRLVNSTDLNCLTYKANKEGFNDNLCLLKAICMHKTGSQRLEKETSKLLSQNIDITPKVTAEAFHGVALEVLHVVERLAE